MSQLRKIKRKDLDVDKYSKALNDALNYRIYAEHWYLDVLTNEKWECLVFGDYEVIMPIPLQFKFGFKFVLQPIYCQQLGVFYEKEISDELFKEFERKLHSYRVRAYHFNEENTERYNPEGEKKVNYVLDLNRPYEEIYNSYRKDRKKNLAKSSILNFTFNKSEDFHYLFKFIDKEYNHLYKFIKGKETLFNVLDEKGHLLSYSISMNQEMSNIRIFVCSKNRIILIGSARNKSNKSKSEFSSYLLDSVVQEFAETTKLIDFEGSNVTGIADFNRSFGASKVIYKKFSNFNWICK